jgi:hypothetical protein
MVDNEFDEVFMSMSISDPVSNTIEEVYRHHYFDIMGKCWRT